VSGTHRVEFVGTSAQTLTMGRPFDQHFRQVVADNGSTLTVATDAFIDDSLSVNPGTTLDILGNTLTVAGSINVPNGAVFQGSGTLDGTAVITGVLTGDVLPGGPSASGVLTILGNPAQNPGSTLDIELGGTAPGTGYDQLAVANPVSPPGGVILQGDLNVSLINAFTPAIGDRFAVVVADSVDGAFANVNFPAPPQDAYFTTLTVKTAGQDTVYVLVEPQVLFAGDSGGGLSRGQFSVAGDGSAITTITTEYSSTGYGYPRWAPNKRYMTYGGNVSVGNNFLHIAEWSGASWLIWHIVNDVDTRRARFSPDGVHIAFECGDAGSFTDVCVVPDVTAPADNIGDTGGPQEKIFVTDVINAGLGGSGAYAWNPLNPDELIVSRDTTLTFLTSRLYLISVDAAGNVSAPTRVTDLPDTVRVQAPMDWSPVAGLVVFAATDGSGNRFLYTVDVATGTVKQITSTVNRRDYAPVFSPDGSKILFYGDTFCTIEWYTVASGGGGEVQLTDEANGSACEGGSNGELTGDWSPDGEYVVFAQIDNATFNTIVYTARNTITAATYPELATAVRGGTPLQDRQPSWRP
jgi:Tol biopolymer transport system component